MPPGPESRAQPAEEVEQSRRILVPRSPNRPQSDVASAVIAAVLATSQTM